MRAIDLLVGMESDMTESRQLFESLDDLDWDDLVAVRERTSEVLDACDRDRSMIGRMLDRVPKQPELRSLCEHYDILDKLVLHDDPSGWRLRLHIFLTGYFDRPHNHRWTYTTRLLSGAYTHTLYGEESPSGDLADVSLLEPRMLTILRPGDSYTLHHSMIHAIAAHGLTVSLVVRGPAQKDRFFVTDRHTGEAWWQYGAQLESAADAAEKQMTDAYLQATIAGLRASGVIGSYDAISDT